MDKREIIFYSTWRLYDINNQVVDFGKCLEIVNRYINKIM